MKSNNRCAEATVLWDRISVTNTVHVNRVEKTNSSGWYRLIKRLLDIVSSTFGLLILFIPLLLLCVVIVIDSPGCPIYSQIRLGKDEKPFTLFKLRTMRIDAESDGQGGLKMMIPGSQRLAECSGTLGLMSFLS